jgi:hypothetical protein
LALDFVSVLPELDLLELDDADSVLVLRVVVLSADLA